MSHDYARGVRAATTLSDVGELCFYADADAIAPLRKGQRFPMSQCISGWAMPHELSVAVPDIEQDNRIPLEPDRPTFVRDLVMVPIRRLTDAPWAPNFALRDLPGARQLQTG